jgi:Signal transduction histidine kinase
VFLDVQTLLFMLGVAYACNLVFSALMIASKQVFPGAMSWLLAQVSAVAGAFLYALLHSIATQLVSLALPNTLFFLAALLIMNSVFRFRFDRPMPPFLWLALPVFACGFCYLLGSTINARIAFFSLFMMLAFFGCAGVLAVGARSGLRFSSLITAISFVLMGLAQLMRGINALVSPVMTDFYAPSLIQGLFLLVSISVAYIMCFGYFMMSGTRFELELREKDLLIEGRNAELRQLNDTNMVMLSVIAHDLRNPIGGAARYVRKHLLPDDVDLSKKRDAIVILSRTLGETDNLLENLLLWAQDRAESGGSDRIPERRAFSIDAIVRPAIEMVAPFAGEKSIEIAYDDTELEIFAERNGSAVVFRNLLTNAVKFTGEGGWIKVEVWDSGAAVEVAVSDSGYGMDSSMVERINSGGAAGSGSASSGESGAGLGLSLCRRFMLKQGGGFRVESALGAGTKFYLSFPKPMRA